MIRGRTSTPMTGMARRSLASIDPWLVAALLLIAVAAIGVWRMPERINLDCAMFLQMGDAIWDGAVPYRDFVDTNMPLIFYLNVIPAGIARMCNVSPIPVFHACVLLLVLLTTLELDVLLRKPRLGMFAARRGLTLLIWVGFYLLADYHGEAGQREHLFIILYVPYLFLRILRHRGGAAPAGFAALLGSKPAWAFC